MSYIIGDPSTTHRTSQRSQCQSLHKRFLPQGLICVAVCPRPAGPAAPSPGPSGALAIARTGGHRRGSGSDASEEHRQYVRRLAEEMETERTLRRIARAKRSHAFAGMIHAAWGCCGGICLLPTMWTKITRDKNYGENIMRIKCYRKILILKK